jgi:hypothetical protein
VTFSSGSAGRDGQRRSIADLKARAITMIDPTGQALATPSALGDLGGSFALARTGTVIADTTSGCGLRFFPDPGSMGNRRSQRGQ